MRVYHAWTFLVFASLTSASAQQTEPVSKNLVLHEGETVIVRAGDPVAIANAAPANGAAVIQRHDQGGTKPLPKMGVWNYLPRPFVFAGAGLMGGGYAPLAADFGAGLRYDFRHLLVNFEGTYDNGHKVNDNTQPNPKGHDRALVGQAYYRMSSGWFFGAGGRWGQLSTTNYTKTNQRATFGGGKDYFHKNCAAEDCIDFSMRLAVDYVLKGTDRMNGLQGPLISFYMPSPSSKGHFFLRQTLGIYTFYTTVTDPTNQLMTKQQMADRHVTSSGSLTLMYRF